MASNVRRYKLGLIIIGVFTLALTVIVLVSAGNSKQDAETTKAAQAAAEKLNAFTDRAASVPVSLQAAGITGVPSSMSYRKLATDSYEFCVTYKSASSGFDAQSTLLDVATGSRSSAYDSLGAGGYSGGSNASSLYIASTHKKGRNCQTIKPYFSAYGSSSLPYDSDSTTQSSLFGGIQTKAADTERKTDINALQAQVEAVYSSDGQYPTLTELNDPAWRSVHMKGIDNAAFRDPVGNTDKLAAKPSAGSYSYEPKTYDGTACNNVDAYCDAYTLTATLETGGTYVKTSFN